MINIEKNCVLDLVRAGIIQQKLKKSNVMALMNEHVKWNIKAETKPFCTEKAPFVVAVDLLFG